MKKTSRLNGIIRALESGHPAFATFSNADIESATVLSGTEYDGVIFEMEHRPWDVRGLQDSLQYMLDRAQILDAGSIAPAVTPMVRIPPNGEEKNQWFAKQALDLGVYGVVWPHINTVEQAHNAVAACRYPTLDGAPLHEPVGLRGDGPRAAARYWGLSQQEYYRKADVWPLNLEGEILVILMIEDQKGVANLRDILENVPGIGLILIGEGDMSQELGCARQYDHPALVEAMKEVVSVCKELDVPVGHPHVNSNNIEQILSEGYRFLITPPVRSYATLEKGRHLTGRS